MTERQRRFVRLTIAWAAAHFVVLLLLQLLAYLATGVPPKLANIDGFIVALTRIQEVLLVFRTALRAIWPGDFVPLPIHYLFAIVNSFAWGAVIAAIRMIVR